MDSTAQVQCSRSCGGHCQVHRRVLLRIGGCAFGRSSSAASFFDNRVAALALAASSMAEPRPRRRSACSSCTKTAGCCPPTSREIAGLSEAIATSGDARVQRQGRVPRLSRFRRRRLCPNGLRPTVSQNIENSSPMSSSPAVGRPRLICKTARRCSPMSRSSTWRAQERRWTQRPPKDIYGIRWIQTPSEQAIEQALAWHTAAQIAFPRRRQRQRPGRAASAGGPARPTWTCKKFVDRLLPMTQNFLTGLSTDVGARRVRGARAGHDHLPDPRYSQVATGRHFTPREDPRSRDREADSCLYSPHTTRHRHGHFVGGPRPNFFAMGRTAGGIVNDLIEMRPLVRPADVMSTQARASTGGRSSDG